MASQSKTPSKALPGKFRLTGFALTLFVLVGLLALSLFFIIGTSIQGEEFSAATFQVRSFQYRRIPGVMLRITKTVYGTPRSIVSASILKHLPGTVPNGRWDVVKLLIERGATVRGAGRDIVPPGVVGVTEFVAAQRNGSKAGQMLEELDLANSIDFGFVLPVRAFRSE